MDYSKWLDRFKIVESETIPIMTEYGTGVYARDTYEIPTQELVNMYIKVKRKWFKSCDDKFFIKKCEKNFSINIWEILW